MTRALLLVLLPSPALGEALTCQFRWEPSVSTSVAGYRLYSAATPGAYRLGTPTVDVPTYAMNHPPLPQWSARCAEGSWWVVTAYTHAGTESLPSNEVVVGRPASPQGLEACPCGFVPLHAFRVSANRSQEGNGPERTTDRDWTTRWAAEGPDVWVEYDLGATRMVYELRIAWYLPIPRRTTFAVLASADARDWHLVWQGQSAGTGTSQTLERLPLPPTTARYVRLVGEQNTQSRWISITEVELWGVWIPPPAPERRER